MLNCFDDSAELVDRVGSYGCSVRTQGKPEIGLANKVSGKNVFDGDIVDFTMNQVSQQFLVTRSLGL